MDILVQTMRKEGILALYKGSSFNNTPPLFSRILTVKLFDRDGQPPSGYRRCQLAALRRVWHLETHHLAIWTALVEGDRGCRRHGGCRECDSREPRGDVQGADAGPVWESVGQAFACCGEGDVG